MKLKRILAGALAAVVSISTVALASLSTASAADPIEADWYGDGAGKIEGAQFKVIQNWNPGTTIDALSGATEFYVSFDVAADTEGLHAYLAFQDIGNKHSNWSYSAAADAACPAVDCSKAGTYTVGYKGDAITTGFNFLAVIFVDAAGKEYPNDSIPATTLKGVYAEAPTAVEPETTEATTEAPTEAGPVQENIDSIEYNFTVTAGTGALKITSQKVGWTEFNGTADVTGNGDYSIKLTGIGATGMTNLGFISGEGFTVTMNNIVVNDKYTFEVGESLTTTTANANGLPNIWNAKGQADVVYTGTADGKTATLVGSTKDSVGITLTVANAAPTAPQPTEATTEPETDPQPTEATTDQPTPPASYTAALSYAAASTWTPSVWNEPSVEITGEGEYSLEWKVSEWTDDQGNGGYQAKGAEVLLIDIPDAAPYFIENGLSIEITSILCDGDEVSIIAPVNQGTLEDKEEMQDWRVSLYNSTNDQGNSIDPDEIYAEDTLTVNFKVVKSDVPTEETTEATTEPTTEPCDVTVSLTPDKAYALPGDEVTYTVAVTPNQPLYTLQMFMNMPEGLAYVPESFVMDENAKANLGFDSLDWTEQTLCLNGVGATPNDITNQTVTLGTFKVLATELGAYTPAFDRYEFCDGEYETISYAVAAAPVEYVTEIPTEETTEAPTEATTGEEPTVAPTEAPVTDPTTVAPTTVKPTNAPDEPTTVATTTAATTTAPTTSGNNGNKNDTPNTGAQAAVGLSIFMAAGLAGVVAIKKRRK